MSQQQIRWGVLYCPRKSILFSASGRWEKIEKCLRANGVEYDFVQSEKSSSVVRLMNMMLNNGYKTIIIVGGDSALNDAVNCIMEADEATRNSVKLGVIPNGLMNDFARYWGFKESELEQTIKWLKEGRVRKVDLGCIRYVNSKGERCHRYFLNCVNIGLLSAIMNLRNQTRKLFGSRTLSYLFSMLLMVFQRLEYRMYLKINDEEIKRKVMTLCVGNAEGYGQTPNAVPYNGLLDVSLVYHPQMAQLIEGFYLLLTGKFLNHKNVHPYRVRNEIIVEAPNALVSVDGRLMGTPVGKYTIGVEQEVINFLIPE